MYEWKNNKIKSQYEMQKMVAKNNGVSSFTEEELSTLNLKTKNFTSIHDQQVKRLVELAYIRGTLNGLQLADTQSEVVSDEKKSAIVITKQVEVQKAVNEERLYFVACKVRNRQDKVVYTNLMLKARTDAEIESMASYECSIKHQTMIQCKIIKSYGTDTMQFQFGIGTKDQTALAALGKKMLQ
jgi:hypothetical protein